MLEREYHRLTSVNSGDAALYRDVLLKVQEATGQLARVFPVLVALWDHPEGGEPGGVAV